MRGETVLRDGWLFHKGEIIVKQSTVKGHTYVEGKIESEKKGPASLLYNDNPDDDRRDVLFCEDRWDRVTIGHDFLINEPVSKENNNALGFVKYDTGWYRRHFSFSKEDENKRITLLFEGVSGRSTVYFNGIEIKHNFSGYNSFECEITDYIRVGEDNVLAVCTRNEKHEGWWYEGAGIFRDVVLIKTEKIAVDLYGVYVHGEKQNNGGWKVFFGTTLVSIEEKSKKVKILTEIIDKNGKTVSKSEKQVTIKPYSKTSVNYETAISDVILWDIDNPYQYMVKTSVFEKENMIDEHYTKTGFRYFECDPDKGFFLNGRHVKINGVCAHEDCGLFGKAVPDNIHRYKIALLKEMGANGYRCSHYMQNKAIMDALDENGFIVMAETRHFSASDESITQLETLIKRDRNRPGVFFWSVGNEETEFFTPRGEKIFKKMKAAVKRLDSTRRIMFAAAYVSGYDKSFGSEDIIGLNYTLPLFEKMHDKFPKIPMISSECCATGPTRDHYFDNDPSRGYISAYDRHTNDWFSGREYTYKFIAKHDYIMGSYQWAGFEHRGEAIFPRLCSQSGAIDLFLQKKDAFYQNKSHFSDKKMIHIMPHLNLPELRGKNIKLRVYTNCEEAELKLNGKLLYRKKTEKYTCIDYEIPCTEGTLEATGFENGKVAAFDRVVTAKKAEALILTPDNHDFKANGVDCVIVSCHAVDCDGNIVPNADVTVDFSCNDLGSFVSCGSDISDHTPVNIPSRRMRAGVITAAFRLKNGEGNFEIYARSSGLSPAVLDIPIKK